ncbi:MAG: linear amide C-N hydrolase, partial [Promethearchaeota archaeon]
VPFLVPDTVIRFSNDTSARTNKEKTLASFKKIDSKNPFYAMKYYGDYDFQEIIVNGRYLYSDIDIDEGWGCTCFAALNFTEPIYGRNFDWRDDGALFLYTQPSYGFSSISTVNLGILGLDPSIDLENPTIQERLLLAPHYLMDGMNEVGLVVGIMAINRASRTYNSSQVTISSLDIVRLALEFASTVDEALFLWENYNIQFDSVPIHYLIADCEGNSAIVEWIDGDMFVYHNKNEWQVSTNFIFTDGISSCWRYQTATQMLQECDGYVKMEKGMEILEACSQDDWTRWSNVYNLKTLEIHITVNTNYQTIYTFQM